MPREVIQPETDGNAVSVGWARNGYAQIGTLPDSGGLESGWFVELKRNDINRLIRTLRKARDQAYGSDA